MKIKKITTIISTAVVLAVPIVTRAQQIVPEDGYEYGDYDLGTAQNLIIFVAKAILGLSGTFAFAMLVWGGIQMIIANGKSEKFKAGTQTVVNALIGLAIIFCSYMIIKFMLDTIGANSSVLNNYVE